MKIILGDVENKDLYENGVFVVGEDVTHIEEDVFDNCNDLKEVIFTKPVSFMHQVNGFSHIYGIFRRNIKLNSLFFPEDQDKIYFPMLLDCASSELEIHLSEKAYKNLCRDIMDYNKNAHIPFSVNLTFDIYDRTTSNEGLISQADNDVEIEKK